MMTLLWNGQVVTCPPACSVADWLQQQGWQGLSAGQGWVIAHNEQVLPHSQWAQTVLQPGDRLDLFTAIAGG